MNKILGEKWMWSTVHVTVLSVGAGQRQINHRNPSPTWEKWRTHFVSMLYGWASSVTNGLFLCYGVSTHVYQIMHYTRTCDESLTPVININWSQSYMYLLRVYLLNYPKYNFPKILFGLNIHKWDQSGYLFS